MSLSILKTKTHKPSLRTEHVIRPRLLDKFMESQHRKLTLISAPAGFGKTTLVSEWIAQSDDHIAWLSLDALDADPIRFLTYFLAALRSVLPDFENGLVDILQTAQTTQTEQIVIQIINSLAMLDDNIVLILDDYHTLDSKPVDDIMVFVLEHMPSQLHIIITTREDPSFSTARLRARGELVEIRASDLRFTIPEATALLNQKMGFELAPEDVSKLDERTEGWIAALQMVAISMHDRVDMKSFIDSFTGSHRYIWDYLVDEVLQHQPTHIKEFLLQTSVLERLTPALCTAVTNQDDTASLLEQLEQANLFVIHLDDERKWYRYHHLFADVLHTHLLKEHSEQIPILHRRASSWYEQNGWQRDAIYHALIIEDYDRAADLIEMTWPALFNGYRPATFLGWIKALPESIVKNRPLLNLGGAWTLAHAGDIESAERHLIDAERWFDIDDMDNSELVVKNKQARESLTESILNARMYLNQAQGDWNMVLDHCQRIFDITTDDQYYTRGLAKCFAGFSYWALGDLARASQALANSLKYFQLAEHTYNSITATSTLGDIKLIEGRLHDARRYYEDALQMVVAPNRFSATRFVDRYIGMSDIYRELNDLQAAEQCLQDGKQEMIAQTLFPGRESRWHSAMSRLRVAEGDLTDALAQLAMAEKLYKPDVFPDLRPIAAQKARIWIIQGKLEAANQWAHEQGLSISDELSYLQEYEHITLARLLISQGNTMDAIHLLKRLHDATKSNGRMGCVIEIMVLQALAHQEAKQMENALAYIQAALKLAEPEGYVRIFVDEGQAMQSLLSASLTDGADATYVMHLLQKFEPDSDIEETSPSGNNLLIEPLSDREMDVLELVAKGLTNQGIADELFIAVSTVKKHLNNIFGKLGVDNRTQAVNRAGELNII